MQFMVKQPEKKILARAIEIQKGHWEHFSEIIKLQFGKKKLYTVMNFTALDK